MRLPGIYDHKKQAFTAVVYCCGAELFESDTKMRFRLPDEQFSNLQTMKNIDMRSRYQLRDGANKAFAVNATHLGHIFPDGPSQPDSAIASTLHRWILNRKNLINNERVCE